MCISCIPRKKHHPQKRLKILLTNGRFPVSIDLSRQLRLAGHYVYVVDPMHYHVCKFSHAVKKSYQTPVPHVDGAEYVNAVFKAVLDADIDIVIPMHEEIFYLAQAWYERPEEEAVRKATLLAPTFPTLIMLHHKWEFGRFLKSIGLDTPAAVLIRDKEDVRKLVGEGHDTEEGGLLKRAFAKDGVALKPVFGRACSNVFHLRHGSDDPKHRVPKDLDISPANHYVAQEWLVGNRYCSYAVIQSGNVLALGVYPVQDTIDGSSCVYFEAINHSGIEKYVEKIADSFKDITHPWQMALDFVEVPKDAATDRSERLVAIECNPRATSGIHLWSGTSHLAMTFTEPQNVTQTIGARQGHKRQLAPGMLMWSPDERGPKAYMQHMKKLMTSKDVLFSAHDVLPSLMQPFLLTSYYEICRERKMELPIMFQWDLTWEPELEEVREVRKLVREEEQRRGVCYEGMDAESLVGGMCESNETVNRVKEGLEVMPGWGDGDSGDKRRGSLIN